MRGKVVGSGCFFQKKGLKIRGEIGGQFGQDTTIFKKIA